MKLFELCDIDDSTVHEQDEINEHLRVESLSARSESELQECCNGKEVNYRTPAKLEKKYLHYPSYN